MKRTFFLKFFCTLSLALFLLFTLRFSFSFAADGTPAVSIENNGSRLAAQTENIQSPVYQWQTADAADGTYTDILGATGKYYDITADDEGTYIRLLVNGLTSEPVGPIGKLITLDIGQGAITLGANYNGKDSNGNAVSGVHEATNLYVIVHSTKETKTTNNISFTGNITDKPFDVTLSGVNMGATPTNHTQQPGSSGSQTPTSGQINIPATQSANKNVTLRLKGENIVRYIQYYNGGDSSSPITVSSSLKITDINGDGAADSSLYVPVKLSAEEIDDFVKTNTNYNHWNAGIGGIDSNSLVQNLHIAGGKIQVVTTLGDNCTAIGAGGNGYCQMEISGGEVIAHCNGTGAAIGGGIGWNAAGGTSNVLISGGKIYAKNHAMIQSGDELVGGVAIGSGSSFHKAGSEGKVTITGGYVEAYGTFGNGIGGGNSSSSTGGQATVSISGGQVTATSIGGGNSKKGAGGAATVTVSGTADVTLNGGIGGGDSESGDGGAATITVTGGSLQCGGVIGGGNGGDNGNGGTAAIHVSNGKLTSQSVGGGIGGTSGNGGSAQITISGGTIETGSIGGGDTLNPSGNLGYAKADISGGDIIGQFIMATGGTEPCTFTMTGGTLHDVNTADTSKYNYVQKNGAAVYMDDPNGIATLSGGTILNCSAQNGGAVYMTAGKFMILGTGSIANCTAEQIGGALYLGGGTLTVEGGSIKSNQAIDGGGVYLGGGIMTVTAGEITNNTASGNGGGAFVDGGNVVVNGGTISYNTATNYGGGITVNNGNYTMTGGNVDGNKSLSASGGGIYVSANASDVTVDIFSGSVSQNSAKLSGGALAVVGKANGTENINVTIGVNEKHYDSEGNPIPCEHGSATALSCPVIQNNSAEASGGAIFVTGNEKTALNLYCLQESGSQVTDGDSQSNFMKMEGGKVLITTSLEQDEAWQTSMYGNTTIENTIYVTGGQMDVWGKMTNPRISEIITVDVEKEGDYFKDHRDVFMYYKLHYYENFTDQFTHITTGQYKSQEITKDEFVTISGNIYSHPGYNIVGWNTDPDGNHNYPVGSDPENPSHGWYDVGKSYLFDGNPIGDLVIYAIWEANGYTVVYDPNIPAGITYTGAMETQIFTYDLPIQLSKNQYGYPGYKFIGWCRQSDGSGEIYTDQQLVTNLTSEKGEVVTLYAQWTPCTHTPEDHVYTYSVIDDGNTLKRECSCKGYSETAALSASSRAYNQLPLAAKVTYSSAWQPEIVYKKGEAILEEAPIFAGTYTASVSEGGKTASVTYTIEKSVQPAPEKPIVYSAVIDSLNGASTLNVYPAADSPLRGTDPSYDSTTQYQIVYYVGETRKETEWKNGEKLEGGFAASFVLDVALTNYYIYARYSEGTNYKASPTTAADSVYFFAGDVNVHVSCGDGVFYDLVVADGNEDQVNGIALTIKAEDGYYFPKDYQIQVDTVEADGKQAVLTEKETFSKYQLDSIPKNCDIYITIPDAAKIPTMDVKLAEKQIFDKITTTAATISHDSSFTICFHVQNYDPTAYAALVLDFNYPLPQDTTLILQNRTTGKYYWTLITTPTTQISLSQFVRMGTADEVFSPTKGELELQFIIDFSETANGISQETLNTTLTAYETTGSRAPQVSHDGTTNLKNIGSFSFMTQGDQLTQAVTCTYTPSQGATSKWDNRKGSLVLIPLTDLPADARVIYTTGNYTTVFYQNSKGYFILPLSVSDSDVLNLTLASDLFPSIVTDYEFTIKWLMSESIAAVAPMNGELLAETTMIFTNEILKSPALKITSDKRLYSGNETMLASVSWANIPTYCDMEVTLMRRSDTGVYTNTGWSTEVEVIGSSSCELPVTLAGQSPGSYCLQIAVMDGLIKIKELNFYFIIEK